MSRYFASLVPIFMRTSWIRQNYTLNIIRPYGVLRVAGMEYPGSFLEIATTLGSSGYGCTPPDMWQRMVHVEVRNGGRKSDGTKKQVQDELCQLIRVMRPQLVTARMIG